MAWVGMGRVEYGRMTRNKERKSNDALRLLQVDRTSGHPGRHGQFQNWVQFLNINTDTS